MEQTYISVLNCPKCGTPIAKDFYVGSVISIRCPHCNKNWKIKEDGELEEKQTLRGKIK
jgi:uncharacterized Zn finger protein (UPF0148 family)